MSQVQILPPRPIISSSYLLGVTPFLVSVAPWCSTFSFLGKNLPVKTTPFGYLFFIHLVIEVVEGGRFGFCSREFDPK